MQNRRSRRIVRELLSKSDVSEPTKQGTADLMSLLMATNAQMKIDTEICLKLPGLLLNDLKLLVFIIMIHPWMFHVRPYAMLTRGYCT